MALISCPECGKEISSMAEKCPNCAYPISNRVNNLKPHTISPSIEDKAQIIEMTSKKLKMDGVFSVMAFVFSFTIMLTGAMIFDSSFVNKIGWIGMLLSGIWMIVNSLRSWWNHG